MKKKKKKLNIKILNKNKRLIIEENKLKKVQKISDSKTFEKQLPKYVKNNKSNQNH